MRLTKKQARDEFLLQYWFFVGILPSVEIFHGWCKRNGLELSITSAAIFLTAFSKEYYIPLEG